MKTLPFSPTLSCLYITGPGEVNLTPMATRINNGEIIIDTTITKTTSNILFMYLAYKGKLNLKPWFFTKKKSFMVEKAHIYIFEKLPLKIANILDIIDRYIIGNIFLFFVEILNLFTKLFVIKLKNRSKINYIRAILIMLAFTVIVAIFIALFGSGRYNGELIR